MSYYLRHDDFTPKTEYKRISEYKDGLVMMKQNGFVYLIITDKDKDKQWETAVNLSCGQIESRTDIETEYDRHGLGFVKLNGIVTLQQVPDAYAEIEKIIASKIGWDEAGKLTKQIADAGLI